MPRVAHAVCQLADEPALGRAQRGEALQVALGHGHVVGRVEGNEKNILNLGRCEDGASCVRIAHCVEFCMRGWPGEDVARHVHRADHSEEVLEHEAVERGHGAEREDGGDAGVGVLLVHVGGAGHLLVL
eukprot:1520939-Pleurochrysis_carterae.AAC.2